MLVGVGGGIAAYKAVELVRLMRAEGAEVLVVMTPDASRFVAPLTFSALASEPVHHSVWDDGSVMPHTELARRADLVVLAPATANMLARAAAGLSDDLLGATLLATRAPVLAAPAMHTEMWEHPAVVHNVATLGSRGVLFVGPETGELAGGDTGVGRMAAPSDIAAAAAAVLGRKSAGPWAGLKVLVSAGGTREAIDSVRFVGNRSSGRQGHAIAAEAASRGASVTLVSSSNLAAPYGVDLVKVTTAAEMQEALEAGFGSADVLFMTAAVADFRPASAHGSKIRRAGGSLSLTLEPTPDILAALAARRRPGQLLIGFAAEEGDVVDRAKEKLASKGVDMVVANDISRPGVGFDGDTNAVSIVSLAGWVQDVAMGNKRQVAAAVLDAAARMMGA